MKPSSLTLTKEAVDNKSQTPSLNNTLIQLNPQNSSFKLKKDSEGVNIPIISKENNNTKKNQREDYIIDEIAPESEPQSFNQPSSFFPKVSSGRRVPTIETSSIKESKLESRLILPTSRSSSDEPVSRKELEITVSGEEKGGQEDSCGTFQSHVYSHNRDELSRILEEQNMAAEQNYEGFEGNSNNPKTITNFTPVASSILSSEASTDMSSILHSPLSVSIDSIHSGKSDVYSAIRDDHTDVAVSPCPSPAPISNTTPLRKGVMRREDRYPSPGAYFAMKSGPMGDLSGGLSPHKRPNFLSTPNTTRNERFPVPSIDTSRPERSMSGRRVMEGWPSSPRRMQLASPRFKSLTDLVEDSEGSEQQAGTLARRSNSSLPSNNESSVVPSPNLDAISEDLEGEDEDKQKEGKKRQEPEQNIRQEHDENAKSKNDGQEKYPSSRSKNPHFVNSPPSCNETLSSSHTGVQSFRKYPPLLSSSRSLSSTTRPPSQGNVGETSILEDMKVMMGEEETSDQEETPDQEQKEKSKGRSEKRLSGSFTSNLGGISEIEEEEEEREEEEEEGEGEEKVKDELVRSMNTRKTRKLGLYLSREKSKEAPKPEPTRNSTGSRITSRFPSIQARRTTPQMLTVRTPLPMLSETEDEEEESGLASDSTGDRPKLPRSSENSDTSTPATPMTPFVQSDPVTPAVSKPLTWRWPKRPFSPARRKQKEVENPRTDDNPADHIGKVGNIWAKKTLGQLRIYHQRHSPSILNKGYGLTSPLKESSSPLMSPVSDLSDSKKSPAITVPEQPLETINEEDEEEEGIGVWSSEEVDLTNSEVDDKSPRSPTIVTPQIIEKSEEPRGMKVSPEFLTVIGSPAVSRDSPNASTTSLPLRNNPSSSSLAKHNAKPIFENTFMISNVTDEPLRYEILWPAFRFDVSPAYGVVKPKSVTVVKISVMNKHLAVGSRRDEARDSKKLMGILKGSGQNDDNRHLMGRTRILVLCENGERGEVVVDMVQARKKTRGEEAEDKSFIRRTVDDLIKAARARTKKSSKPEERNPRSTSVAKGKSSASKATGSSSKPSGSPAALRRSASSRPTSRPNSPDSNNNRPLRRHAATPSTRSRPNTPDAHRSLSEQTSPSPVSRSRTPERKNFISIGEPGVVSCPNTTIREENHSVFRIHNPTNKPVTWHLKTVTNPFLRRSDSTNSSQKINDEVFLIMKTCGLLRAGTTERVVVSFRPMLAGTYYQSFMLEDSSSPETSVGGMSVRIQGEGKVDTPSQSKVDARRNVGSKAIDFEVTEKEVQISPTKVGKRKSVAIKINNPSSHLIRIKCKCEVEGGGNSNSILSIPLSSVQIKPRASVLLPVRFSPKEAGEVRAVVKLQAVGRNEVQVDVVAEGVIDASAEVSQ